MLNRRLLLITFCLVAVLTIRPNIKLTANYNASLVHSFASIATPLEVPLSIPRLHDPNPISQTPINEKYAIGLFKPEPPNLEYAGLHEKMVHIDYQMVYEENPPASIFQDKYSEEYHLLEIREFHITMANPSEVFTICVNEIFSDCDSIKKMVKRNLPVCLNPFTKYPFYFNLYVTHFKNRELLKPSIFFNVTFRYENQVVSSRVWMRQMKFTLNPNHLKLLPFEIRNCENENSVVAIKNPEKHDLSFLVIHKFKKYHTNGQPLDDKFTIGPQKTFRFMLEAKDSTMTIYSKPVDNSQRSYPVLYVPVYCFDKAVIQNIPIGIISSNRLALTYPILITSNTNSVLTVQEITLTSTSGTVELIRTSSQKTQIQSIQRHAQVGSFIVRSAMKTSFKNSITVRVKFSISSSNNGTFQARRTMTYCQLYNVIDVGENRFYQLSKLPDREYNETEKIRYFNYSIINRMQIPIRMQRILFNSQKFRMHWFRYTGLYIFPERVKEEIMLEYIGGRELAFSPLKFAAAIEFSGGIVVPFEVAVFDRTLACMYQGKEVRCSALKYVNFGYQKNEQRVQTQTVVFRNFNPHDVTLTVSKLPGLIKTHGLDFTMAFSQPFPFYENALMRDDSKMVILVKNGHIVNLTIEMRIHGQPTSGQSLLNISTEYQQFSPKVKFNFQEGRLLFTPPIYQIDYFDRQHQGKLYLLSTFQDIYQIREIVADTTALEFYFNETQQYEPNQSIEIPFAYNPYRDENNLTTQCCSQDFLKSYYMHSLIYYEQSNARSHQVTLVTNTDYEQHLKIKVDIHKASLLSTPGEKKVVLSALNIGNRAKVCLTVNNPYPSTLKYNVFFIPDAVIYKPKDYSDYFKHARREKVDAYVCFVVNKKTNQMFNALKTLFRLQQAPVKVQISVDAMGNIQYDSNQKDNISTNEYVNSVVQTGEEMCYKINTFIYFKLLIQSQILNIMLQRYPFDTVQKFMEKEWQHMQNTSVSYIDDDFYEGLELKWRDYCNFAFFPIFRFCLHYPIEVVQMGKEQGKTKQKPGQALYLSAGQSSDLCFVINSQRTTKREDSFEMVIANNYSRYDDYKIELSLIQPKVSVGNIAFERNHIINHEIFIKHYFSSLAKATSQQLLRQGLQNRHKIIPVYLTNQDYQEEFGLFKGQRYFQIQNHSPKDIEFSHFGFENRENISEWSGISIQTDQGNNNQIILPRNNKTVFKLSLCLDQPFEFNLTNPYFHKKVNLYLYKDDQFYLSLTLLFRVADNVIQKLKVHAQPQQTQRNRFGYLLVNFISFAYICFVILDLKREENEKVKKMQIALEKQKKIVPQKKEVREENYEMGFVEEKLKKKHHVLLPESIGAKIKVDEENRHAPIHIVTEQELLFFKSLKIEKDKSVYSESSDQPILRFATEQVEKQEKSQKSDRDSHDHEQSRLNSSRNEQAEQGSQLYSEQSEESLSESILPDGISVCNQQLDTLDEFDDFQFGFQSKGGSAKKEEKKVKKQEEFVYYDVFSNHNPLKKEKEEKKENPFPWMNQNEKKKRTKRVKKEKEEKEEDM